MLQAKGSAISAGAKPPARGRDEGGDAMSSMIAEMKRSSPFQLRKVQEAEMSEVAPTTRVGQSTVTLTSAPSLPQPAPPMQPNSAMPSVPRPSTQASNNTQFQPRSASMTPSQAVLRPVGGLAPTKASLPATTTSSTVATSSVAAVPVQSGGYKPRSPRPFRSKSPALVGQQPSPPTYNQLQLDNSTGGKWGVNESAVQKVVPSADQYRPQAPAPSPYRPQAPAPSPYRPQAPAPSPYRPQATAPMPYRPQASAPTPNLPQAPASTPYLPQAPASTPYLPQAPAPTPYLPQAPAPTPYLPQAPAPTPYLPQAPAPTPYLPQAPAPTPFLPQAPAPTPYLPQAPAPTPFLPQAPAPTPYLPQAPAPTPYLPQAPAPTPYLPQAPAPTPYLPQAPAPTPHRPQAPAPTPHLPQASIPTPSIDLLTALLPTVQPVTGQPGKKVLCGVCQGDVTGRYCTFNDTPYHSTCFICSKCSASLVETQFYEKDGIFLCENCHLKTLARCAACGEMVRERLLQAGDLTFHPDCFVCSTCQKPLSTTPFAFGPDKKTAVSS
uniref:skin secretory protein xP2-like n=1 Tax=Myxine glutinosa TaxID=7769 RepID=UPI00358EF37A